MKSLLHLDRKPWLFTLLVVVLWVVCNILVTIALSLILQLKDYTQAPPPWTTLLPHILTVFVVAPFVLGFPGERHRYGDYLSEIRLTKMRPLLGLVLLGLSCYLIQSLSQAAGVLAFRSAQGLQVNWSFIRSSFVLADELPPRSMSWVISLPSILEEVVWRGVILAAFLRVHDQRKAILFTALCFGLWHILSVLEGRPLIWTVSQVVWAAVLGLFYGYVTLKADSLLPAMIVHYLGNLFVSAINAYIQANASVLALAVYGVIFTFGIVPTSLMMLWTRLATRWLLVRRP